MANLASAVSWCLTNASCTVYTDLLYRGGELRMQKLRVALDVFKEVHKQRAIPRVRTTTPFQEIDHFCQRSDTIKRHRQKNPAKIPLLQLSSTCTLVLGCSDLLNKLIELEKEDMAFHLAIATRRNAIIKKLRAGDKLNVQASNLDIVLVPAEASSKFNIEHGIYDCQEFEALESLREMESQEGLATDTAVELKEEIVTQNAGPFSYCLYADALVITSEVSWLSTR
ncbi:hypothetical protein BJ741DRAFT_581891 [Chytriomyces cf. hyalinus JEL632]|nr:hypothetical protein BJ741DRAFT_581891 [Chytriomyces cf. hyalinus JEL632]